MTVPTSEQVSLTTGSEAIDALTATVAHLKATVPAFEDRVFDSYADESVDRYPLCVVVLYDTHDTNTSNGYRVLTHVSLLVKVIAPAKSYDALNGDVAAVDAAMRSMTSVRHTFGVHRERPYANTVPEGGKAYREVGGIYKMQVRATPGT